MVWSFVCSILPWTIQIIDS